MYVLIIFLMGHSPVMHDFNNEKSCQAAAQKIADYSNSYGKEFGLVFMGCVKK